MSLDALLSDGSTVHIRQITPEDAERIVALHQRFSDRTRYLRYFAPYPRIPARDLQRFVNVDHVDREALVVAVASGDLVAVGRYERLGPASPDAEVAFVVEDAYQGKGIGSLLLEHLAEAARSAGITRFVAEVLMENQTMLRVFADAGYQVNRQFDGGVVHLTLSIEPTRASEEKQRAREYHPEAASIARLLAPASVAVYGVRRDGTGVGAAVLRHIVEGGFTGSVAVVHPAVPAPREPGDVVPTLGGVPAYPSAAGMSAPPDLAVVAVPADAVPVAVADAGAAGAHAVVVLSGGFAELAERSGGSVAELAERSGGSVAELAERASERAADQVVDPSGGMAKQRELVAIARAHGLRLVGPNCLGIMNTDPGVLLNATLAPRSAPRGRVGLFCQSASTAIAMISEVDRRAIGVSTFVSVGNRADVSGNDLLQYWRSDPHTDVVLLYLETFGNPHKFARIARELGREKPIVAVAAGAAAGPGSGADRVTWAGGTPPVDESVTALFAHSGVIRVETISQLLDVGQILATCPLPASSRVAVVGNSAALVQLADAACARAGLEVTFTRGAAPGQPMSVLTTNVAAALGRDEVDIVLVVAAPPLPGMTPGDSGMSPKDAVDAIAAALPRDGTRSGQAPPGEVAPAGPDKPVVVVAIGSPSAVDGQLPCFRTVEEAVRALRHVVTYAQWRRTPLGSVPQLSNVDVAAARAVVAQEGPVAELLAAYGITIGPGEAGVECVVEVMDDPAFGPVVGFGVGGIATALLRDRAWRVAPLTDVDAAALVRAPRAAALLQGYGGAQPVDLAALEDLLLRVGRLADENPGVKRLRLDPVLAHATGLSVVHADVTYGEPNPRPDTGPRRLR